MVTTSEVIAAVNQFRRDIGFNELIVSDQLMRLAAAKAADHLLGGYPDPSTVPGPCAHISPRLGSPIDQARSAGYCYYPYELYAGSRGQMVNPINLWRNSPCHDQWLRATFAINPVCGIFTQTDITNARMEVQNLTHIGVGYAFNPATNGDEWVLIMANERQPYTSMFDPYRASCGSTPIAAPPPVPPPAACSNPTPPPPTCQTGWRQENNSWAYYQLVNNQCVRKTGWQFNAETNVMKQTLRISTVGATHNWFYIDPNTGVWSGWVWNEIDQSWYLFWTDNNWYKYQCDTNNQNCQFIQQSGGPFR
ncbi:hypothetical protein [Bacillus sp. ISL-7]|uniref:CAP domain-containing protein n=1 Tax=Bacillus sp. ISL-7 TaxID=2819136 RepID=UPI001BEA126D|nr:hypothetical protein [Bacillus sp. ISL-7]MBT2734103.1 hypothetical protein [Bacillus sp. ISL-7]